MYSAKSSNQLRITFESWKHDVKSAKVKRIPIVINCFVFYQLSCDRVVWLSHGVLLSLMPKYWKSEIISIRWSHRLYINIQVAEFLFCWTNLLSESLYILIQKHLDLVRRFLNIILFHCFICLAKLSSVQFSMNRFSQNNNLSWVAFNLILRANVHRVSSSHCTKLLMCIFILFFFNLANWKVFFCWSP